MEIKQLFDPSRDIHRTIEKVITYNASQEARLKAEISEYVVTESIEEQIESLLLNMQTAMDNGGENEVGVWVSGFYGSGKSSFTKYLGLALDDRIQINGVPFLRHLQDRLTRPQTKALLSTVASRFSTAVVMLDLASEMLAGATMEDVSTVLYYKVLQEAGYSRNLKVAVLERKLQSDGRYEEFVNRINEELGVPWTEVQNDPLVIDSVLPEIAHELYPDMFRSPNAFNTDTSDFVSFENERVLEMIDIVRQATGKEYILFVIDEVGQYVASRPNLILNLDGLAKNLKAVGDGKVWIVGTAQQTLTEDDPRAALNSPELYKLAARFPIQIDLEAGDIKEICYRRLLGKSAKGEHLLAEMFDRHGQELRQNTRLHDAEYYDAEFDRQTFINLYPFLPAHFDILLHLLGALAKSTGGIGLRSAIKVVQDILIESQDGRPAAADQPIGWLATTVAMYDALHRDIQRAVPSLHAAVSKAMLRYPDSEIHQRVAKTVAVLQILSNMPVTPQNVAALMHPALGQASIRDEVDAAVRELINDAYVPFGEQDGSLCFFSEKLNDVDQERSQLPVRSLEARRIQNDALRGIFSPLPSTRLQGLTVSSGIKSVWGGPESSLAGERNTIQTVIQLVEPSQYDDTRAQLLDESRQPIAQHRVYLLGRANPEIESKTAEIYRCREIAQRYRNDPDEEVRKYCTGQSDRANVLQSELEDLLKRSLVQGSFIFRGQVTAVESLDHNVLDAAKKHLADVAKEVFDRYAEAPVRAETALAEKFLRVENLRAVTSAIDPLGLVQISSGNPRIQGEHRALVSISDHLKRHGTVEGRRLTDYFTDAPFGWSPDTLRYLVAALLVGGEIKLRVSGREITVNGQQTIEALRTNNAFKAVGVALRIERPSTETLARAAERLTELAGEQVIPLEDEISKVAARCFAKLQHRFGPLGEKLDSLGLPGGEEVGLLNDEIAEVLSSDASDAPDRLGSEQSSLHETLAWAMNVDKALKNGMETTIRQLQLHIRGIEALPESGIPGQLRTDVAVTFDQVRERLHRNTFWTYASDLATALRAIETEVGAAASRMAEAQGSTIRRAQEELERLSEWTELTNEEQQGTLGRLESLALETTVDLQGLKALVNQQYTIQSKTASEKQGIQALGRKRQIARITDEVQQVKQNGYKRLRRQVNVPSRVQDAAQLDEIIEQLQSIRSELSVYGEIDVIIQIED